MEINEDIVIGNYKITKVTISDGWGDNWGIRGNNSKVIEFARIDLNTKETWLQRVALRRLPIIEFIEGIARKKDSQYAYSISNVSGYVPHESEYTRGIWLGSEEALVDFFTKKIQSERDAEVKRQNDFAIACSRNK